MRFQSLEVENFRAITSLAMSDLPDVVVIAGPNGCGKSSVFDAVRLLKSVYGGYQPNEWQQWMSEFQINLNRRQDELLGLLQDKTKPLRICVTISLSDVERQWLCDSVESVSWEMAWQLAVPDSEPSYFRPRPLAAKLRQHEAEVEKKAKAEAPKLLKELEQDLHTGEFVIRPDGNIHIRPSRVLETAFSIYHPDVIGIIDYHGPQRTYSREAVGGINLNIESSEDRLRQHALYNYQNKYSNIKTELAAGYVRELIAQHAGARQTDTDKLLVTLKELFGLFFPGKEFLGPEPTPDGALLFNVRTAGGTVHDINELSSGEKEVLYGYLRLRNAAPRNSVLLIDEPELHLNPRLTDGLPEFYHRHLGKALQNQLWLATHSDAILRQAVGRESFRVYHMQPPDSLEPGTNQVREVLISEELERAVIDLVGDLAAYRPGAKLVIVEGGGESEFDVRVLRELFPELTNRVNLIPGGNRGRVEDLYELLQTARRAGALPLEVFSITDRDFNVGDTATESTILRWGRFHIENYLLEEHYIVRVLKDLHISNMENVTEDLVTRQLKECAQETISSLVRHHLEVYANRELVRQIRTAIDRNKTDLTAALLATIEASMDRLIQASTSVLTKQNLGQLEAQHRARLETDLQTGEWKKTYRGRDIMRLYTSKYMAGHIKYPVLRDLIVGRMRDDGFRPEGMQFVITRILKGA